MKKQIKSKIATLLMLTMVFTCLAGCGKQTANTQTVIDSADDTETIEVNQNDFRGGIKRIEAIRGNILNIVNGFNEQNFAIQTELPCSYWSSEEYQYFIAHFISGDIYQYTDLFNEFETDWETVDTSVKGMLANSEGNLPQGFALERVTDNHYTLTFEESKVMTDYRLKPSDTIWLWDCIYNPTHDWVQTVQYGTSSMGTDKTKYQTRFLEYGRRGNVFIMQTEFERLFVIYENTEPITVENTSMYILNNKGKEIPVTQEDIDSGAVNIEDVQYHTNSIITYNPLKNNTIKAFYYSRLDGNILPKYLNVEASSLEEEVDGLGTRGVKDETIDYDAVTEEGYVKTHYNTCDSIFLHIDDITKDWVTSEGTYQQVVTYENGDLTVKTANQLSQQYEIFKFFSNGNVENHTEPLVIPEPVTVSVSENEVEEEDESDNPSVSSDELPHYALYDMEANCDSIDTTLYLGYRDLGKELPMTIGDLKGYDFETNIEETDFIDNEDMALIFFKAYRTADGKTTENYFDIGSYSDTGEALDSANIEVAILSQDSVQEGRYVDKLCNISIGMSLDDVRKMYGEGETLNDGIGFFDGTSYLYVQTDLFKDDEDNSYYGINKVIYISKTWVDGLMSGYTAPTEPIVTADETADETTGETTEK